MRRKNRDELGVDSRTRPTGGAMFSGNIHKQRRNSTNMTTSVLLVLRMTGIRLQD